MMKPTDGPSTSSTLVRRLVDPADFSAWLDFATCYTPLLRLWCRRAGLDHHGAEEVAQTVLIELSSKLRDFRYDPGGSFRGWLWTLCRNRITDRRRAEQRQGGAVRQFSDMSLDAFQELFDTTDLAAAENAADSGPSSLLRLAERAQAAVRKRVNPKTWDAFVLIEFQAHSIQETADALGLTYAATYGAHARVLRMLREEGERLRDVSPDANE